MRHEPLWWARARELRAKGLTWPSIARLVKKDHTTVMYAVDEEFRRRRLALKNEANKNRAPQKSATPEAKHRQKVTRTALLEAEARGVNPDLILKEWGEPMRRCA